MPIIVDASIYQRQVFLSNFAAFLFELQLPVVFIDSHHDTKEGKEASLWTNLFISLYFRKITFTAALRFESFLERQAPFGVSFKTHDLGKV